MRLIDADALTEFLKCLMPERGMWEIEGDPAKDAICETVAEAIEMVKNMETIQPEKSQLSQEGTTKDTISRQAAIDEIKSVYEWHDTVTMERLVEHFNNLPTIQPETHWIPVSERLPSKEERKEWIDNNLDGIGYLYPCLVTRYSSINPDRTKNNPYVAKHYFDGEDFLNAGEEVCSEYIIAWMPLPEPYKPNK